MRQKSKYGARKTVVDGIVFDSRKEARRYSELLLLQKAGAIHGLERQKKFVLIPAQYERYERISEKTGKQLAEGRRCVEKECAYIADFVYWENGKMIVEDTKGVRTKDYIIKRKLMLWLLKIRIKEV